MLKPSHRTKLYIVLPKAELKSFINKADREYFSRPVEVEHIATSITTPKNPLLYVREIARNRQYPCDRKSIKRGHQLTNKQRANAI